MSLSFSQHTNLTYLIIFVRHLYMNVVLSRDLVWMHFDLELENVIKLTSNNDTRYKIP